MPPTRSASTTLQAEPTCKYCRRLSEELTCAKFNMDTWLPICTRERRDGELPRRNVSHTEACPPKRVAAFCTLQPDPSRTNERREGVEPELAKSNREQDDSVRAVDRNDELEPSAVKLSTDVDVPIRAAERIDKAEPIAVDAKIESVLARRAVFRKDDEDPRFA